MTVPSAAAFPPVVTYAYNGGHYAVPFQFIDVADLLVTHINIPGGLETVLTYGLHYTVAGGNFDIGAIDLILPINIGHAVGIPDQIRIERATKLSQPLDATGGDFTNENVERALDRMTMFLQELERRIYDATGIRGIVSKYLAPGAGIGMKNTNDGGIPQLVISSLITAETIRDTIAAALYAGSGITIVPDDEGDRITINCTVQGVDSLADMVMLSGDQQSGGVNETGGTGFAESVLDVVGAALQGAGLTVSYNDVGNTILLTASVGSEEVRDIIGQALSGGFGVTVTPNDVGDTIQVAVDQPAVLESVRDMLAIALQGIGLVSIVNNDGTDVIQVTSTALDPSYKGLARDAILDVDFNFSLAMHGRGVLFSAATNKTGTLLPESALAYPAGYAVVIRNGGPGNLVIARGVGVALFKNGSTVNANATIAPGGIAQIVRWDNDSFSIVGPGVS